MISRGKDILTGELVVGRYFLHKINREPIKHVIDTGTARYDVDKSTIVACTGQNDKNEKPIFIGDRIKDEEGRMGTVVFIYGANRVSLDGYDGHLLFFNSSLLHNDHGSAARFEIIDDD